MEFLFEKKNLYTVPDPVLGFLYSCLLEIIGVFGSNGIVDKNEDKDLDSFPTLFNLEETSGYAQAIRLACIKSNFKKIRAFFEEYKKAEFGSSEEKWNECKDETFTVLIAAMYQKCVKDPYFLDFLRLNYYRFCFHHLGAYEDMYEDEEDTIISYLTEFIQKLLSKEIDMLICNYPEKIFTEDNSND